MTKMAGKLIVFEGIDGSGKGTQSGKAFEELRRQGIDSKLVIYPNYNSDSSHFVKRYLDGEFGEAVTDINPYAVSTFFALDRYLSIGEWFNYYHDDDESIVLCDRYVSSNIAYQAVRYSRKVDRNRFIEWCTSLEYTKFGMPQATATIFLDMPPYYAAKLIEERGEKDINESDIMYLDKVYGVYKRMSAKRTWYTIPCVRNETFRDIEDIHHDVMRLIAVFCKRVIV